MRIAGFLLACGLGALALGAWLPAGAQPSPSPAGPTPIPPANVPAPPRPSGTTPPALPPQPVTADVSGFRTARFGMTQEQVREAIKADFNIEGNDIKAGANDQEKTKYLAIQVPNLVPDSGLAVVTYIFGYSSQKLIQVNISWGKGAGQVPKPNELVATGRLLQQYFQSQGFARDTMIVNRATNNGSVVLFNGYDEKKRSVLLLLVTEAMPVGGPAPAPAPGAKAPAGKPDPKAPPKPADNKPGDKKPPEMQLVTVSLLLSYIESASNPDVFRIQKGKF